MTDPSWLYSTIAQSSAAIVAIVGGFITASVLYLSAEKRSLVKRLDEMKAKLSSLENVSLVRKDKLSEEEMTKRGERIEAKREEAEFVRREILNIKRQLDAFSYPPHLDLGLFILVFFTAGSILFPVAVILAELFYSSVKWSVYILFCFGLAAVLCYIGYQIWQLRRY